MDTQANTPAQTPTELAVQFFERLSPSDLTRMDQIYSDDAYFKDPFNDVKGVAAITHIFAHMFAKVDKPTFIVSSSITQNTEAFLVWDFHLSFKGENKPRVIHGSSHLRFDTNGKINYHRDYWDAAEELYEKLPFIGGFMRFLKRQANKT